MYANKVPPAVARQIGRWSFADFDRRSTLLWLAVGFVALLLVTGRLRGLRALAGLAASLVVVVEFAIPAILHGRSPVGVAVVSGASEETLYLVSTQSTISLRGLLVAGMVIGALGVLVDLTVSQASTVMALRRANPRLGFGGLVREALDVGHDHIAATVNTLVFAYAGAALPTLLIFTIGHVTFTDAVNGEAVATEVVAALVGSIGLILSMPLTTALAALRAERMDAGSLPEHAHAH